MADTKIRVLYAAIARILRPLIHILIRNGISYGTFADLAKWLFVDIANREFAIEGRKQTISRVTEDCIRFNALPDEIRENNQKICLKSKEYEDDLTVYGNNVTLIGKTGKNCAVDGGTTLSGRVTIKRNNATFKNIKFEGPVIEKGNNTKFINSCYF